MLEELIEMRQLPVVEFHDWAMRYIVRCDEERVQQHAILNLLILQKFFSLSFLCNSMLFSLRYRFRLTLTLMLVMIRNQKKKIEKNVLFIIFLSSVE